MNCGKYAIDEDKCLECLTNYFMNDEKQCIEIDVGILNCEEYQEKEICNTCFSNYYPAQDGSSCNLVDEDRKVENCEYYKSSQDCDVCKDNYFLNPLTLDCDLIEIVNC